MRTAQGSFLMETTYTWEVVDGGTLMTLLNIGSPSGLGSLTAPVVARAMPAPAPVCDTSGARCRAGS
jgi:hypothetical protein